MEQQLANSVLLQKDGQNYFVPAQSLHNQVMRVIKQKHPNLKRNDPCICNSKKKFKKCCGRVRSAEELKAIMEKMNAKTLEQQKEHNRRGSSISSGGIT